MIQGLRNFAFLVALIGALGAAFGALSFAIDIPGMSVNGRPVETNEDKVLFVSIASGFGIAALVLLVGLRKETLQRYAPIWRAAYWVEILPNEGSRNAWLAVPLVAINFAAGLVAAPAGTEQALAFIKNSLMMLVGGFGGSVLVLGFQVLNPMCPRRLLLAFSLLAFSLLTIGAGVATLEVLAQKAPPFGAESAIGAVGFAQGAAFVVRRWTDFEPLIDAPASG